MSCTVIIPENCIVNYTQQRNTNIHIIASFIALHN